MLREERSRGLGLAALVQTGSLRQILRLLVSMPIMLAPRRTRANDRQERVASHPPAREPATPAWI